MFRNIYRALVVSRTKSAAIQVANQLSHHQLKDIGHSRSDIVRSAVETVTKELDQADFQRTLKASSKRTAATFWSEANVNALMRQLSSTRSYD
jgi:uncharacterized protein YjiS (DUF1127 family)